MAEQTPLQLERIATAMGANAQAAEEIEKQLREMGLDVDKLHRIVTDLDHIKTDMRRLLEECTPAGLNLKAKTDGSFEVYSWVSGTKIGSIEKDCVEQNGMYKCLSDLLSNKLKIAEKLLDQYLLKLISLSIWLREAKPKIAKSTELVK
jgi:hypothetical protein